MQTVQRVRYFAGQVLTAEDLIAEQEYFRECNRRHNRCAHGWGVVCGLKVAYSGPNQITVQPGLALDCLGNEVALPAEARLEIPKRAKKLFLAIEYAEILTDPVPVALGGVEFRRVREQARLALTDLDPCASHQGYGSGTPGCGRAHPVTIALLVKQANSWSVKHRNRIDA